MTYTMDMVVMYFSAYLHKFLQSNTHCWSYYMPGMKVYVTDEKEIIMEPSLKWAGNPNILIAVKAFGLKATVQVFASVLVD